MAIAEIVTRGYGTFGTIADVARRGYTAGVFVAPTQTLRPNELLIDPDTLYPPFVGLGEPPQYLPPTVSMRSGFRTSPDDLVREWTGYWVSRADLDKRNPQDFVKGRKELQRAFNPEPDDVFLNVGDVDRGDF